MKNIRSIHFSKENKNKFDKKNKKGVIEVQFNWIFILIAGFVIFIFIIGIIFSQKSNAEKQSTIQISNQIITLLKGKQQTADVYSEINFPHASINFRCEMIENASYFSFKIDGSDRVVLPTEVIFAPKDITTDKLIVWTQAFNLGFPINIFSYITTSDIIILIINDSNTDTYYAKELSENIPSNITHHVIDMTDLNNYVSNKNKKVVCFADNCNNIPIGYDYIEITPSSYQSDLFSYGNITFRKSGLSVTPEPLPYIAKAGLLGAIFSDTKDYYYCQMSRAMNHYEIKRDLTERRLVMIQNDTSNNNCKQKINITLVQNIKPYENIIFNYINITSLYKNTIDLDIRNSDLTLSSCPKLY